MHLILDTQLKASRTIKEHVCCTSVKKNAGKERLVNANSEPKGDSFQESRDKGTIQNEII